MSESQPRVNRLGRGLDSLIPTDVDEFAAASMPSQLKLDEAKIQDLPINEIAPNPHQPRTGFATEDLADLAASIKLHGIVQPLIVVKSPSGYQLIAGERRLRAAKQLAMTTVPAIIRSFTEQQKLEVALIENIQRTDLKPLELASAYRKLNDQFNLTIEAIGQRVGKAGSTVANIMRLLNLPHEAKQALNDGVISEGHARTLLSVTDPANQLAMLELIIKGHLNVRQAEELARNFKKDTSFSSKRVQAKAAYEQAMVDRLVKRLATKVDIQKTAKGGKVVIEFYSDAQLSQIIEQIAGKENN